SLTSRARERRRAARRRGTCGFALIAASGDRRGSCGGGVAGRGCGAGSGAGGFRGGRACLFGLDQPGEGAPERGKGGVRPDSERLKAWVLLESLLLALDDRFVLHEALDQAVEQRSGDSRVLPFEVVEISPEKVGGALGLRCHVLTVAILACVVHVAFLGTRA